MPTNTKPIKHETSSHLPTTWFQWTDTKSIFSKVLRLTEERPVKRIRLAGCSAHSVSSWREPPASREGKVAMTTRGPGGNLARSSKVRHSFRCLPRPIFSASVNHQPHHPKDKDSPQCQIACMVSSALLLSHRQLVGLGK